MTLTVTSATTIDRDCVEVHASGPRGGSHEFTVHYDRRGAVKHAYQHNPAGGYLQDYAIPLVIKEAAAKERGV